MDFADEVAAFGQCIAKVVDRLQTEEAVKHSLILPANYQRRLALKERGGHKRSTLEVKGDRGSGFIINLREAAENPLDFSAILSYVLPDSGRGCILKRYNGNSHIHENRLERERFEYAFHIHTLTERYQESDHKDEGYAERTDRYSDLAGALKCLIADCNFQLPPGTPEQISMF